MLLVLPARCALPGGAGVPTSAGGVELGNYLGRMRYCTLISATGGPALSVPGGFRADGLPVGLHGVVAPRVDRRLLEWARRRPALG